MAIIVNRINVTGNMNVGIPPVISAPWTESDVLTNLGSGLSVWLKQTNQVTVGSISEWGTNATQSNFYMKDYGHLGPQTAGFASIPGQFGGASALQLNNSGWMERDWYTGPYFTEIFQRTSYHIFAVVRVASVNTNNVNNYENDAVLGDTNGAAQAGFFCFKGSSAPYTMYSYHKTDSGLGNSAGGYALEANGTVSLNTDYLMETWYDGTALNVRLGNNPPATVSIGSLTGGFNSYDLRLGANNFGGTLDGAVASVMFCTSALDATSQSKVREYFGTTYGVAY